ncbi:LOW QUALITY PROTEIN: P-type ATPase, subfamily V [Kipferlia bialata]|uniref:P-type ATPase, subfamily V n=1 Tax=Kipferlia bialata TaxID=797122 RepID=A0A9K3D0D2_9EUKA|nr:LOW QUALITY PROTEIN: P-type ATPase, subfamily V [Kipferlia bialata]
MAVARQRVAADRTLSLGKELTKLMDEQKRYIAAMRKHQQEKMMEKLGMPSMDMEDMMGEEDDLTFRVGDASIAAPFTAKSGLISGVIDVIRQGRCTLVTTLQTYKTLALQCVISAYSYAVLTLDGVRASDTQMMISSMISTTMLMSVSRAKPLQTIAKKPPPHSVISPGGA